MPYFDQFDTIVVLDTGGLRVCLHIGSPGEESIGPLESWKRLQYQKNRVASGREERRCWVYQCQCVVFGALSEI